MTGRTSTLAPLVVGISLMAGGLSLLSYEIFSPRQRAAGAAHENGAAATTASPLEAWTGGYRGGRPRRRAVVSVQGRLARRTQGPAP